MHKVLFFIIGLMFANLFVSASYAQTQAECSFEWRVCKANDPGNDPLYYADQCYYPSQTCYDRARLTVTPEKEVCFKEYRDCVYNSCGTYRDSEIVPCARRCLRKEQACQKAASKPIQQPSYTPPPNNNSSGIGNNSAIELSVAIKGETNDSSPSNDFIERAVDCQQAGGKMLNGVCVDEPQEFDANSEDSIRKKLGTDLETMKAVSDLGGRNARTCVGAKTDNEGFLYIKNICGKPVNFGYCYDGWVHKRPTASNPFKCDTTGKLAWGGASSVRGSEEWRAPLQADSVSRKLIFGPCMAEVFHNDRKYSYLHSQRTSATFRGGTGKYKCIYIKSAGQD